MALQTKGQYKTKNEQLAHDLKNFLEKNELGDVSIYFNNQCFRIDHAGNLKVLTDIKASTYFEYAHDEGVSMSFEGDLNHIINYDKNRTLLKKFNAIFDKHNCYYVLGYAWSLSVYYE